MKKLFSLIRTSMSEGMNLFNVNTKKKNNLTKTVVPILLALILMSSIGSYSEILIEKLESINMKIVVLVIFVLLTSILTIIEGIYKSGNLLFNCKDDNLLLSLPIKKSTVLFIRVFKFYVFELLYNTLFLLPSIVVYAIHVKPGIIYYIVSIIGLFIFPIIPILISCLIGTFITSMSSRFKGKNIAQTIITFIFVLGIMYVSFNFEKIIANIAENASSINDFISKIYYPAGAYANLITDFSILKLLEFVFSNLLLFVITIILIGKLYFNINSNVKAIKTNKINKTNNISNGYKVKSNKPIIALIKKELSRFINSPVFVTNAAFGLLLFILGCIIVVVRTDSILDRIIQIKPDITIEYIKGYMPIILFGFVFFSSLMTSITSSMISLEGKSFNILKTLPVRANTIIRAKILTAVLVMIPCILIGDLIVFIKFKFDFLNILLILVASILFPLLSEKIGIIVNLKYPKMDARNDTEVVKQSMSSTISVFGGMVLIGITLYLLYKVLMANIATNLIMFIFIAAYTVIYIGLSIFLNKICEKSFNNIIV